jgi:hypothetical protein
MRARLLTLGYRFFKWGGLLLGAAMVAFLVWSDTHWTSMTPTEHWNFCFQHGSVYITELPQFWIGGWSRPPPPETFHWWPGRTLDWNPIPYYPLWPVPALLLGGSAIAWVAEAVARRRSLADSCVKCKYDRTGIAATARCPECGTMPICSASN